MTLFDYDGKVAQRDSLQENMNTADFWNDQEAAQKVISEFKLLKAQTEGLENVISEYEDATVGYELAKEAGDEELLIEVDGQLFKLKRRMEKV